MFFRGDMHAKQNKKFSSERNAIPKKSGTAA